MLKTAFISTLSKRHTIVIIGVIVPHDAIIVEGRRERVLVTVAVNIGGRDPRSLVHGRGDVDGPGVGRNTPETSVLLHPLRYFQGWRGKNGGFGRFSSCSGRRISIPSL